MTEEIIKYKKPEIIIPKCQFKKTGLIIKKDLSFEEWEEVGNFLNDLEDATQWTRGDWLLYAIPKKWDQGKIKIMVEDMDWNYATVTNLRCLCGRIEFSRRRENLTFAHHQEVAKFDNDMQDHWLNEAEKNNWLVKELRRQIRVAKIKPSNLPELSEKYRLFCCDIKDVGDKIEDDSIDWIITDPPYAKEYLYLIDDLAEFSFRKLKKGGSLICMIGQSYLPFVYSSLSEKLEYFWTCAYVTEGRKTILWGKNIMIGWKPLLWFSKEKIKLDKRVIDLFKSDMPEKDIYEWAQSESGMRDVIERITEPGQIICDPFLGAGTTGVAAIKLKRFFIGVDIDQDKLEITKSRFE